MILRRSGATTAALTQVAATNGVRTVNRAQGGGVLYLDEAANLDRVRDLLLANLDRLLGVCNRLNLLLVHRAIATCECPRGRSRGTIGVDPRACSKTESPCARAFSSFTTPPSATRSGSLAHSTATIDTVTSLLEVVVIANDETSGLAAEIVTESPDAAAPFCGTYRGVKSPITRSCPNQRYRDVIHRET